MTQDEAFKMLTMGKNVFLTGAAGSGKTHLINRYIEWLTERGIEPAVTATTGIAATHIQGQTIHSWSGIGIRERLSHYDLDALTQKEDLVKRLSRTKVLIIDEISMLAAHTFDMVDEVLRAVCMSSEPFGGIQVVVCGDFFQLPPVVRGSGGAPFAFESEAWRALELSTCYLTTQHRQKDDTLTAILFALRSGTVDDRVRELLMSRVGVEASEDIPHLYTHNVDVDRQNQERLDALPGYPKRYEMKASGSKAKVESLKKGLLVPETLELKADASVMFVKNDPQNKYVNGTLGVVLKFAESGYPLVRTHEGKLVEAEPASWRIEEGDKVRAEVTQVPLRLAWAVTVHKSQGITLDAARMDLAKTFVPGQGYVALSRVRSLEGLFLDGLSENALARDPRVAEADERLQQGSERIVSRLAQTAEERLHELVKKFVERSGGHEPDPAKRRSARKATSKQSTQEKTLALVKEGKSLKEIAKARGLVPQTIVGHLEELLASSKITQKDIAHIKKESGLSEKALKEIRSAFEKTKERSLGPVRAKLKNKYSFEELRLARLFTM